MPCVRNYINLYKVTYGLCGLNDLFMVDLNESTKRHACNRMFNGLHSILI